MKSVLFRRTNIKNPEIENRKQSPKYVLFIYNQKPFDFFYISKKNQKFFHHRWERFFSDRFFLETRLPPLVSLGIK